MYQFNRDSSLILYRTVWNHNTIIAKTVYLLMPVHFDWFKKENKFYSHVSEVAMFVFSTYNYFVFVYSIRCFCWLLLVASEWYYNVLIYRLGWLYIGTTHNVLIYLRHTNENDYYYCPPWPISFIIIMSSTMTSDASYIRRYIDTDIHRWRCYSVID